MSKIGFTDEMLDTLRSMKGKTFKSYECLKDPSDKMLATAGNLRINLGRSSIELRCELELVEDFVGDPDGAAALSCVPVDPKSEYIPWFVGAPKAYMVDERIKDVELVRDHVVYRNTENREVCAIDMDVALVIRTKYHTFCFSIDQWFYEEINISITAPDSSDLKITSLNELLLDISDLTVEASRELVRL